MKKSYLAMLVSVAFISALIGYSIKAKLTDDTINPIATDSTKDSVAKTNNNQTNVNENKQDVELTYKRDLNKDGVEETIKVVFQVIGEKYFVTITSESKQYTYEAHDVSGMITNVRFADFDTKDKYIEFYINTDGPSDDPSSAIYRFDNDGIKKIYDTTGYIKEYNGEGQIYTDFSKTNDKFGIVLSYYDIDEGKVVFNDKDKLIGKKLQYENSLILFNDSADKNGSCKSYIDDNLGKEELSKIVAGYNKDNIIKVCEPNEVLTISDIDNTFHGMFKDGTERNIRIKVKTSEGKEGWLEWLNGGD